MNMNMTYVAEILRATGSLQSGDPAGVTAIIQNALAAAGLTGADGGRGLGRPHTPASSCPRRAFRATRSRSRPASAADRSAAEAPERGHRDPAIGWNGQA